jgi:hypothetical protein
MAQILTEAPSAGNGILLMKNMINIIRIFYDNMKYDNCVLC